MSLSRTPLIRRTLTAAVAAAAALVAGCSSGDTTDKPPNGTAKSSTSGPTAGSPPGAAAPGTSAEAPPAADDPALKAFHTQKLDWKPCPPDPGAPGTGGSLQCARLRVPLDYAAPGGKTVDLAVYRLPSPGPASSRLGRLMVNPGGPGSSARGMVLSVGGGTSGLARRYDIVGFDPRGTGGSGKINCADGPLMDRLQSLDPTPADAAAVDTAADVLKQFGQGCAARTGDLLPRVGTTEAVNDMDVFRAALGDAKLNYLGASYGTYLGARYADRFPGRVGRMVLDGLLDPAQDRIANAREQALGFEAAFDSFTADCLTRTGCPFTGSTDAAARSMRATLDRLSATPATAGGRALDEAMASTAIANNLYSTRQWPELRQALAALYAGNALPMIRAFDQYADRAADGTYARSTLPGYFAINCADGRVLSAPEAAQLSREITATAPVLGPAVVWSWAADCATPGPDLAKPLDGSRIPPMLLVSTTRDPATPHAAAARLQRQLPNAALLTYDGDGHTARTDSACAARAIDTYLLNGTLPAAGIRCAG